MGIFPSCRPVGRLMRGTMLGAPHGTNWGGAGSVPAISGRFGSARRTSASTTRTLRPLPRQPRDQRARAAPPRRPCRSHEGSAPCASPGVLVAACRGSEARAEGQRRHGGMVARVVLQERFGNQEDDPDEDPDRHGEEHKSDGSVDLHALRPHRPPPPHAPEEPLPQHRCGRSGIRAVLRTWPQTETAAGT